VRSAVPRPRNPGVEELRRIADLHPEGVEVIEAGGISGQALDLMASAADRYPEPAHGLEDGADVVTGELACEFTDRTTLGLVATSQVRLEGFTDELVHAGQRTPELQLAPTSIPTGASPPLRRGADVHGLPTDQTVHEHGHPPAPTQGHVLGRYFLYTRTVADLSGLQPRGSGGQQLCGRGTGGAQLLARVDALRGTPGDQRGEEAWHHRC